jgi:hypothetical protein
MTLQYIKTVATIVVLAVMTVLALAYVKERERRAAAEAEINTVKRYEEKIQAAAQEQVQHVEDDRARTVQRLERQKEAISNASDARKVLADVRGLPTPVVNNPNTNNGGSVRNAFPDSPSAVNQKDNLLCYDEPGQIALAKYTKSCEESGLNADSYKKQSDSKDVIIASQKKELDTISRAQHPSFLSKVWTVTKWAAPAAGLAYAAGRAHK